MRKIIQIASILLILGMVVPLSAKNSKVQRQAKKQLSTVDFMGYNSTSTPAYVSLYNTNTNEWTYYYVPANTPTAGVVLGQLPQNNDIYSGSVQMLDSTPRTMQLYFTYGSNTTYIYGTDMALACGACAFVRIY